MNLPQSGRRPVELLPEDIREILRKRHKADRFDYFATDPDHDIRLLGRLALRRSDINDLFALGDLCAQHVETEDHRLRVFYVGKTLVAYQRALQAALLPTDRELARRMLHDFTAWVQAEALAYPSPRNVAVALWALAEDDPGVTPDPEALESLLHSYRQALGSVDDSDVTRFADARSDYGSFVTQSAATMVDYGVDERILATHDDEVVESDETRVEKSVAQHQASVELDASGVKLGPLPRRSSQTPDDEFGVGDHIEGRYEVVDIRRGGMGIVYLCYDRDQREPVAIKTFQARFLNNERAVTRFNNEAVTWVKLEKHRHVVHARLVQNINGRPHIFLEHISAEEGYSPDLRGWIDHNRLDLRQAIEFGLHIALGMQHATRKVPGLVHRDLKPANILVTHDAIAKVTDFGLVRSLELEDIPLAAEDSTPDDEPMLRGAPLTRVGAVVGTAPYMSPEQCRSQPVDVRSDIYAFGCVLHEMLTGRHVFEARRFREWLDAHLQWTPRFKPREHDDIPVALQELTLYCLEKDPNQRPAHWGVLVDSLAQIYQQVTGQPAVLEVTGPALEARELMDKGYSLTELGRLNEALVAYDSAIALKPDYAWAWARRGRTLRVLGRYEEALRCYDRALEVQPSYAFAWNGKGIVLERMGHLERALACYQKAAEINPADVWHWCNQADVLVAMNRQREAIPLLEKALQQDPAHPNSWAKLGQVYRLLQDYPQSIKAYEQAIRRAPEYAWAHNGYGLSLKLNGQLEEALLSFKRAARYEPNEVWHWYNMVETLILLNQYEEAVHPAQRAVQVDPNHAPSWSKLGQVLRYVKRYEEALQAYDRSLALQPDSGWVINGKGIAYERMGRYEEALECYRRAADAGVWLAYFNQANIMVRLGRNEEAVPLLEKATRVNPDHAKSWARLGSALRSLKRLNEALSAHRQATRLEPDYAWAWNEQGITLEMMGQYEEALQAYQQAHQHAPDDPLYLYQQADLLVSHTTNYAQALDLLNQALVRDGRNPRFWAKHGQALRRLNRYEEALTSYTRSIELDPTYAWAWNGRGLTLSALNRHEDALYCFQQASQADPQDVWYWYNQGDELTILGRLEEALVALDRALAVNPHHADSWAKRGQALRRMGQLQEALTAYDQALRLNPTFDFAWNGRGLILHALGHREEALASYQRASEQDPTNITYYISQIDVLLDMQQKEEALRVVDLAIKQQPENATLWARRGQVLRRIGDNESAIDSYQKALELDDAYAWAWNGQGLAFSALGRWEEALACYELAVHYNETDSWFWHNYGEALMNLDDHAQAIRAFEQALHLNPGHDQAREKLEQARQQTTKGD
jgi:tetratricopeptide (TPR) repeat protein